MNVMNKIKKIRFNRTKYNKSKKPFFVEEWKKKHSPCLHIYPPTRHVICTGGVYKSIHLLEVEGVNEFILPVCIKTILERGGENNILHWRETHQGASGYGGHLTATSVGFIHISFAHNHLGIRLSAPLSTVEIISFQFSYLPESLDFCYQQLALIPSPAYLLASRLW